MRAITTILIRMSRVRPKSAIVILTAVIFSSHFCYSQSRIALNRVSSIRLNKKIGNIDQVVSLAEGRILVRDYNYSNETMQAIEVYDRGGQFRNKIGTFGKSPGQYYRLKALAIDSGGIIWAADVTGRVTRFSQDGRLINTKLIQNPGYQIYGLALDEDRGRYFLSGCLPKKTYLDAGCRLVHQYGLKNGDYQKSFLETDPEALEKHLLALEDYHLDIDRQGSIWAADGPIRKIFRIDSATGQIKSFPIKSRMAAPVAALNPRKIGDVVALYENSILIDRVFAVGSYIVVSIGQLKTGKFHLQIFDNLGNQVTTDLNSPGRLVGKTRNGHLYFATREPQGFEISEYSLNAGKQ